MPNPIFSGTAPVVAFALGVTLFGAHSPVDAAPQALPIFDGESLKGWNGDPKLWRVEDGCIVGQTNEADPIPENTFLIWEDGEVDDFELTLDYAIEGGNTGIQIRSFALPKIHPWRVGGYQADIDANNKFTGILYGEKYRGILGMRGQKTTIGEDGKPVVRETFGEHKTLAEGIKLKGWNRYRIVAKGHTIQTFINGTLRTEVTDEDTDQRRRSGLVAFQLHKGPAMKVRFKNIKLRRLPMEDRKKIVFLAGKPSHGWGAHEHNAGSLLLADALKESASDQVITTVYRSGWPRDPSALENADAIIMFCDGGKRHMANWHLRQIDELADKGVGIGCIHYGVEVPKGEASDHMLDWIGGVFEIHWSVNPHWTASFDSFPDHPVSRGVQPFSARDEWYYHMRFREGMENVTPILSDLPPKESLNRPDGHHSGNPHVRRAVADGERQHVMWVSERPGANRGFGFTGAHFHQNWADDNFRKVVLNAILWIAGGDVPESGVASSTPSTEALDANQDFPKPTAN